MTKKRFTLALFALSFTGCAPKVTIADGAHGAGEGGEATNGGQSGGGSMPTGGASKGGTSTGGASTGGSNHAGGGAGGNAPGGVANGGLPSHGGETTTAGRGGDAGSGECTGTIDEEGQVSHQSLETYCDEHGGCPSTLEEAQARIQELCGTFPPSALEGIYGCGAIRVGYDGWAGTEIGGFVSGGYLFDEASRELIGAFDSSDTPHGPCGALTYVGGTRVESCSPTPRCGICSTGFGVDCRLDCDCTEPPGVDPCHDPTSCGCYCERLAATAGG
ncbi:MAG TPA: hypothetical protein VMS65_00120 [Polyangiaceae bacterium]|nr:hypothetical protein [Polyangiaceae bacterium]